MRVPRLLLRSWMYHLGPDFQRRACLRLTRGSGLRSKSGLPPSHRGSYRPTMKSLQVSTWLGTAALSGPIRMTPRTLFSLVSCTCYQVSPHLRRTLLTRGIQARTRDPANAQVTSPQSMSTCSSRLGSRLPERLTTSFRLAERSETRPSRPPRCWAMYSLFQQQPVPPEALQPNAPPHDGDYAHRVRGYILS